MITEPISIRRGLSLYKQPIRPGGGSRFWYARVYMPIGERALHVKSTRTTDVGEAKRKAEQFWADCAIEQRLGSRDRPPLSGPC